jgi:hypothetical protein
LIDLKKKEKEEHDKMSRKVKAPSSKVRMR